MDETTLPGAEGQPAAPVPSAPATPGPPLPPPMPPEGVPVAPRKRRILTTPFVMGLITPLILLWGVGAAVAAFASLLGAAGPVSIGFGAFLGIFFVVGLVLFIVGRQTGRETMRAYGLGVMASYAAFGLLALLAYGTCGVLLGGTGA